MPIIDTSARSLWAGLTMAGGLCVPGGWITAQQPPPIAPEIQEFIQTALDTIQAVTLRADTVDWGMIRDSTLILAAGAEQTSDTYAALNWALRRANKHSFLQAPKPGAVSRLVADRIGYIRIPPRGGAGIALADSLHTAVAELRGRSCGWMIDLRGNGGGNMWPMLAGIGPLLGDSAVGGFHLGSMTQEWRYRDGRSSIIHPDGRVEQISAVTVPVERMIDLAAPIAVLIDRGTASSGEAVAIAFLGRPSTRTFGQPSAGYATTNRGSRLPDGANMVVTVGYNFDRTGHEHVDQVTPDEVVPGTPPPGWPAPTDGTARAALAWLGLHPHCAAH